MEWYEIEKLDEGYFLHIYDEDEHITTRYFDSYQYAREIGERETRGMGYYDPSDEPEWFPGETRKRQGNPKNAGPQAEGEGEEKWKK